MPGPIETEIKLRIASAAVAREALARIGAVLKRPRHLEDNTLFDFEEKTLRTRGVVLRLRTTPAGAVVTFKGPYHLEGGMKSREEVEAHLAETEAGAMRTILLGLGLLPDFRYQKHRETFAWGGQEIVIDETPIGTFLEIEGDVPGINAAAAALGFTPADYLTGSYAALFVAAGGKGDMVF